MEEDSTTYHTVYKKSKNWNFPHYCIAFVFRLKVAAMDNTKKIKSLGTKIDEL